jgi:hypothetical protein
MVSDVLSGANGGIAARYAAQIRELLTLSLDHLDAQYPAKASSAPADQVRSPAAGAQGTVVDLRA